MPDAALAVVFPGQGSQYVGMGVALCAEAPTAKARFQEASDILGFDLLAKCATGPEEALQETLTAQLAIFTASVAAWEAMAERGPAPVAVAGHSLGEYSALAASGALDFSSCIKLVAARAGFMQEAVRASRGGMLAVVGLAPDKTAAVCADVCAKKPGCLCMVANYNSPQQQAVSADADLVAELQAVFKAAGAKMVKPLKVSGAFHSPYMQPAANRLAEELLRQPLRDPAIPLAANCDGKTRRSSEELRKALIAQMPSSVRWVDCVETMARECGATRFAEVGPGTVLQGLIKRIIPTADVPHWEKPSDRA